MLRRLPWVVAGHSIPAELARERTPAHAAGSTNEKGRPCPPLSVRYLPVAAVSAGLGGGGVFASTVISSVTSSPSIVPPWSRVLFHVRP